MGSDVTLTSNRGKIKVEFLIGEIGLGGSERQLYLLLKHLDRSLFDCRVIVFNPSDDAILKEALESEGVPVMLLPGDCRGLWRRARFVYRALRERSPDVVHSWTFHDNPYAGVIGMLAGIPVRFGSVRGSLSLPGSRRLPVIMRWLSLHSVLRLVVNSDSILQELVQSGYPRDRVIILRNGVEVPSDNGESVDLSRLGIEAQHRVVATVGNLREVKNHQMFVEGMASVLANFPDVRATIVGQPISREPAVPERLDARIRELGLVDRITLAGFCPNVPALMSRLSIFCLTSFSEGMPNAILEAMAASRPVVATRVGGIVELVRDGVNGILVESGDVEGFAHAVEYLLKNPDIATRMGTAGRELVRDNFSCEQASRRLGDLFRGAVHQGRLG